MRAVSLLIRLAVVAVVKSKALDVSCATTSVEVPTETVVKSEALQASSKHHVGFFP